MNLVRWSVLYLLVALGCSEDTFPLQQLAAAVEDASVPRTTDVEEADAGRGVDAGLSADVPGAEAPTCFDLREPSPRPNGLPADCPLDPDFGEDWARTPAASYFGEVAAIELSGAFHAPWELYKRTREEACQMFASDDRLAPVFEGRAKDTRPTVIIFPRDSNARRSMLDGSYAGWRCWAPLVALRTEATTFNREPAVAVFVEGTFELGRLFEKFQALPDVESVAIMPFLLGNFAAISCIFEEGGEHHYVLQTVNISSIPEAGRQVWYFVSSEVGMQLVGSVEGIVAGELPAFVPERCR